MGRLVTGSPLAKWMEGSNCHTATNNPLPLAILFDRSAGYRLWYNLRERHHHKTLRKSGSRNTTVTSDFRPEVEIWPYRACAIKNLQHNPYLMAESRNFFIGTLRLLRTWLWGRYHVPHKVFLVNHVVAVVITYRQ